MDSFVGELSASRLDILVIKIQTTRRKLTVQRVESSPENCLAIIASVPPPSGP
jgi:hypothetical protein